MLELPILKQEIYGLLANGRQGSTSQLTDCS
jgi:hypothetical protein